MTRTDDSCFLCGSPSKAEPFGPEGPPTPEEIMVYHAAGKVAVKAMRSPTKKEQAAALRLLAELTILAAKDEESVRHFLPNPDDHHWLDAWLRLRKPGWRTPTERI